MQSWGLAAGHAILAVSLSAVLAGDTTSTESAGPAPQRPRPPASLKCSRDHLTAFQGRVLDYKRGKQDIALRLRTDEGTTQSVTLKWMASEKPETWFLLRGEPFKAGDWKAIERGAGALLDGMRVFVWVCDDGSKPVLDWRPKEG